MDERSGIGAQPHGPSFAPPPLTGAHGVAPAGDQEPPPRTRREAGEGSPSPSGAPQPVAGPHRTRSSRWSAVLTVAAVLLVGLIVMVATVITAREDSRPVASRVASSPVSAAPNRADRMEFVTADADGVLIVARRIWSSSGARRPAFGSFLHIEVELVCRNGTLAYGPENFSAFDASGDLFDVSSGGRWGTPLGYGILLAGDSVRGTIAFDLPRGEVTLLMSDDSSSSVTAVKIPD